MLHADKLRCFECGTYLEDGFFCCPECGKSRNEIEAENAEEAENEIFEEHYFNNSETSEIEFLDYPETEHPDIKDII